VKTVTDCAAVLVVMLVVQSQPAVGRADVHRSSGTAAGPARQQQPAGLTAGRDRPTQPALAPRMRAILLVTAVSTN